MKTTGIFLTSKGKSKQAFESRPLELPPIKKGEVLIEVEAFGLNYADVMARNGLYRDAPPMPCVLGYEVVGKVIECPENQALIGKRVAAFTRFGGYAKHAITGINAVVEIGEMDANAALSLCTQGVTAYYMCNWLAMVRKGEKVLIHAAAGGVGTILIQLCKLKGAEVIAKVGSRHKIDLVKQLGADHAVNYKSEDYAHKVKDLIQGFKLDVAFNPVGGSTFKKDFKLIGPGGRLILFGASELSDAKTIFGKLRFLKRMGLKMPIILAATSKNLLGVNMLKIADSKPEVLAYCLQEVAGLYRDGHLNLSEGKEFNAKDIASAHELLESGKSTGKISIHW